MLRRRLLSKLAILTLVAIISSAQAVTAKAYHFKPAPPYWTDSDQKLAKVVRFDQQSFLSIEKITGYHPDPYYDGYYSKGEVGEKFDAVQIGVRERRDAQLAELALSLRSALANRGYIILIDSESGDKAGCGYLLVFRGDDPHEILMRLSKSHRFSWDAPHQNYPLLEAQLKEWEVRYQSAVIGFGNMVYVYFPNQSPTVDSLKDMRGKGPSNFYFHSYVPLKTGKMLVLGW
jgi:hypothetical protein